MKRISLVAAALIAVAVSVQAHEFFVIPEEARDYRAGETVNIQALSSHYFFVGEELEPPEVNEVYVMRNGRRGSALPLKANPDRLWYETSYTFADSNPVIVVGNRIGGFYCIFTDGGYADGTRAEAVAANPGKTVATARYFAKYSKLYLNSSASDSSFSTPLGHDIEIIPLDNPARLKRGSNARFQVLYRGQPLANADVNATWDYYNYRTANSYALAGKTNARGEVTFRIGSSGLWLVRVSDTRRSARPGTDEDNLAAIVVFSVK